MHHLSWSNSDFQPQHLVMFCLHDKWIPKIKHLICVQYICHPLCSSLTKKTEVKRKPPCGFVSLILNKTKVCLASYKKLNSFTSKSMAEEFSVRHRGSYSKAKEQSLPHPTHKKKKIRRGLYWSCFPCPFYIKIYQEIIEVKNF